MLVDEYQDTNVAQYLWLRLLAQAPPETSCCVGDDDQSIYGWRGAEVDNILRFEQDFPGAKVIRLERNYRSTGHILAAASALIAHNEGRLGKTLCTEDEPGEKVTVIGAWDSEEEARRDRRGDRGAAAPRAIALRDRRSWCALVPDARVRGALRHARPALPRHRRPALLRARRDPRRPRLSALRRQPGRRPRLRAHRQHAQARPRRRDAAACSTTMPARAQRPADAGGALRGRDRGAEAEAARRRCATCSTAFARWAQLDRDHAASPSSPRRSWRSPATPRCGRTTARPTRPGGSRTSRNWCAPWRSSRPGGLPRARLAGHGRRTTATARERVRS